MAERIDEAIGARAEVRNLPCDEDMRQIVEDTLADADFNYSEYSLPNVRPEFLWDAFRGSSLADIVPNMKKLPEAVLLAVDQEIEPEDVSVLVWHRRSPKQQFIPYNQREEIAEFEKNPEVDVSDIGDIYCVTWNSVHDWEGGLSLRFIKYLDAGRAAVRQTFSIHTDWLTELPVVNAELAMGTPQDNRYTIVQIIKRVASSEEEAAYFIRLVKEARKTE